jgi:hypothetical protein
MNKNYGLILYCFCRLRQWRNGSSSLGSSDGMDVIATVQYQSLSSYLFDWPRINNICSWQFYVWFQISQHMVDATSMTEATTATTHRGSRQWQTFLWIGQRSNETKVGCVMILWYFLLISMRLKRRSFYLNIKWKNPSLIRKLPSRARIIKHNENLNFLMQSGDCNEIAHYLLRDLTS